MKYRSNNSVKLGEIYNKEVTNIFLHYSTLSTLDLCSYSIKLIKLFHLLAPELSIVTTLCNDNWKSVTFEIVISIYFMIYNFP